MGLFTMSPSFVWDWGDHQAPPKEVSLLRLGLTSCQGILLCFPLCLATNLLKALQQL